MCAIIFDEPLICMEERLNFVVCMPQQNCLAGGNNVIALHFRAITVGKNMWNSIPPNVLQVEPTSKDGASTEGCVYGGRRNCGFFCGFDFRKTHS